MGVALWRSRAVPRWLAVLFTVGVELAESMGAIGPKVVLFMLPFAAAMTLLAVRIWQDRRPSGPDDRHHMGTGGNNVAGTAVARLADSSRGI